MDTNKAPFTLVAGIAQTLFSLRAFEDNPATEQALADTFGVSRMPIRDALKELEKDGLVERRKGKGVWLKRPSITEMAELHDVRCVLEGFTCRLASERIREQDLSELRRSARIFEQADAK